VDRAGRGGYSFLRSILTLIFASVVLGSSAGSAFGVDSQHAQQLLMSMLQDVAAILNSFAGGPNDPTNPVTNSAALAQDAARLDGATRKANELAVELQRIQDEATQRVSR
jgi:hypothetical protein